LTTPACSLTSNLPLASILRLAHRARTATQWAMISRQRKCGRASLTDSKSADGDISQRNAERADNTAWGRTGNCVAYQPSARQPLLIHYRITRCRPVSWMTLRQTLIRTQVHGCPEYPPASAGMMVPDAGSRSDGCSSEKEHWGFRKPQRSRVKVPPAIVLVLEVMLHSRGVPGQTCP
jgi:hypothetical protein